MVAAILAGCPFLSINYASKHEDLLASLGLADAGINPGEASADAIMAAFENRDSFDWVTAHQRLGEFRDFQKSESTRFIADIGGKVKV